MTTHLIMSNPWSQNNNLQNKKLLNEKNSYIIQDLFKIAAKELREDDTVRRQCLAQLREWIKQNPDIENCLTDENFLLRFLRVKKFSIPMAQQCLLKYLNFRKRFKYFMYDMDYKDPKVNELITNGYIYASPIRDSKGRRVIIYDLSKFDPHKYSNADMTRAHVITYETLLCDDENQILGVNHVADVSSVNPAFATLFSVNEFATLVKWGEQSMPLRHKEINFINLPTALVYVYNFAVSRMSPKLKERCKIHSSMKDIVKHVDKQCLPLEFGGDIPSQTMIELWKEELAEKRQRLLSFDTMNLISAAGIITSKNSPTNDDTGIGSLPGSFRKLELD
ncbi:retinaldehyde-binding protein 1 [Aethina tumida]|uniref:retinaldehyde-binding protein 1 n=1 Tax=Aethina tumida TaxID=116153 RepID=UPI0021482D7F|nr:retinaldehyde-binding protein 1 [Aethina tumida]